MEDLWQWQALNFKSRSTKLGVGSAGACRWPQGCREGAWGPPAAGRPGGVQVDCLARGPSARPGPSPRAPGAGRGPPQWQGSQLSRARPSLRQRGLPRPLRTPRGPGPRARNLKGRAARAPALGKPGHGTGRHSGWHRALRPPGPGPCVPTKGKGGISACCRQARVLPWPLSPQRKTSALRRITGAKDPVT